MYNVHVHVYTVEVKKSLRSVCVLFRLRFHYCCNYRARALVVTFSAVFYSVSGSSGGGYAAPGSHHVRGPGLSSCTWKRVVVTWACGVGPARQILCGRQRDH